MGLKLPPFESGAEHAVTGTISWQAHGRLNAVAINGHMHDAVERNGIASSILP
jgi:hypothetical protein